MTIDVVQRLRDWGTCLEQALNIPLVVDERGTLVLKTKAGRVFGITPAPEEALIFTGVLGVADDAMRGNTLRALLAVNMTPSLTGTGSVGLVPDTREIALRLTWMPVEVNWTEQLFAAALAAFAEHVDALASLIASGEIEQFVTFSSSSDPAAIEAEDFSDLV
ncbi:CesT family type III secretion system chaperone [Bordetella tumulicola]|uniref:CesT family type III secretion system chaperone n=1 Tax=Bordetella tumulicola TaxID=1649133 RepID=UPI0039EDEBA5